MNSLSYVPLLALEFKVISKLVKLLSNFLYAGIFFVFTCGITRRNKQCQKQVPEYNNAVLQA